MTTLGIGGPARYYLKAENESQLIEALAFAESERLETFVLGGGSNVLISDKGFDGLVLHIALHGIELQDDVEAGKVLVIAAAGEDWDNFVEHCVEKGFAGLECMSGIPGSVGGTPVQNVGAYGQEASETIVSVRCFDRGSRSVVELSNEECGFSYRRSIFNTNERERYVVLSVTYRLEAGGGPRLIYPELISEVASRRNEDGETASLREVREAVLRIRRRKSMVIDPEDPNSKSAGSFFKNPVVSEAVYSTLAASVDLPVPMFRVEGGGVKIPAAWLIEHAGIEKGFCLGNAGISRNHSLAIINIGGAAAAEVIALKEHIQLKVKERFNLDLIPEPVFIGF
jgi:UDP-N-acetylmuramate dehydrogenase